MTKLTEKNEEYKKINMELRRKMQEFQKIKSGSEKQHTVLEKAQKKFDKEIAAKDAKINRLQEEVEKFKYQAKGQKTNLTEVSQEDNKVTKKIIQENKKLEQQRNELLLGFKKQIKLIDLLKRQITHLEAAQM